MNENPDVKGRLSFEWDQAAERLEIHGDDAGLERLASMLQALVSGSQNDHCHLMTPDWGGGELTSEQENVAATLVNHVKILRWD